MEYFKIYDDDIETLYDSGCVKDFFDLLVDTMRKKRHRNMPNEEAAKKLVEENLIEELDGKYMPMMLVERLNLSASRSKSGRTGGYSSGLSRCKSLQIEANAKQIEANTKQDGSKPEANRSKVAIPEETRQEETRQEETRQEEKDSCPTVPVETVKPVKSLYPPDFETFWAVYPKKSGKGDAVAAWKGIKAPKPELPVILAAAAAYKRIRDNANDPTYTKLPATWIRSRCWEDDQTPNEPKATKASALDKILENHPHITPESTLNPPNQKWGTIQ